MLNHPCTTFDVCSGRLIASNPYKAPFSIRRFGFHMVAKQTHKLVSVSQVSMLGLGIAATSRAPSIYEASQTSMSSYPGNILRRRRILGGGAEYSYVMLLYI